MYNKNFEIPESIRVERFCETSANADDDDDEDAIDKLSSLMCQSHQSLDTLYECSHPNLDKLVDLSEELGVGARLVSDKLVGVSRNISPSLT